MYRTPGPTFTPQPYRPAPRDGTVVRVRSKRAFLLGGDRVEPMVWIAVPRWMADEILSCRADAEVERR